LGGREGQDQSGRQGEDKPGSKDPNEMEMPELEKLGKSLVTSLDKNILTLHTQLNAFKDCTFGTKQKVKSLTDLAESAKQVKDKLAVLVSTKQSKSIKVWRETVAESFQKNKACSEENKAIGKILKMEVASTKGY